MSRHSIGPRLDRRDDSPYWYIVWADGSGRLKRRTTGATDRAVAETTLAAFLLERGAADSPGIIPLIESYQAERGPLIAAVERVEYAAKPLAKHFAGKTVEDLTAASIREYVSGRSVRPATIARELTVLRAALRHAVKMGRLRAAPAIEVPPQAPPRERWLTRKEATKLLTACHLPHLRLFILLALNTGARRGAILGLGWDQVDLKHARIDFNPPGRAQTAKRRPVVPINRPLLAALKAARKGAKTEFVVEYQGEGLAGIRRAFNDACRAAKLKGVTPHTLRHTAATWMAQGGVPLAEIAGILGQSIQRTTERYIKHHPDHLRRGVDALSIGWGGIRAETVGNSGKRRKTVAVNGK